MRENPVLSGTVEFPPFRLDIANERLLEDSRPIPLTPKAFALLSLLVQRAGRLVTKDEILANVWKGTHVQDAVLKVCIRELRRALNDPARQPRYIETVHRRGYRFVGSISGMTLAPERGDRDRFVGRGAELAQLRDRLRRAAHGERQIVFVTGEPGIGKTAVVEAFLERDADPGVWVARGTCLEQYGAGEAYLPVLEAVGRLARDASRRPRLVDLLRRHAPTWLAQLPALVDEEDREALRHETLGATSERMLREMAEAIEALTSAVSLLLVLEDLQWSDYSTLDLIASLARRREPARLLLIGTYRHADVVLSHHPLRTVKRELQMRRQCCELPLEFLSEPSVAEYLRERYPDSAFPGELVRSIHRRTEGNPLFMVNVIDYLEARDIIGGAGRDLDLDLVLREVRSGVPESLRQMIEQQIDRLSVFEQSVLEAASVAGLEFSALAVAAGLESAVSRSDEACEDLARRGQFLRSIGIGRLPDGTVTARYGFIHSLYQNVLYHRLPLARRLRLHQRIGERGLTVYGDRVGEIAAELAVHFEQARDYRGAVSHLRRAADNAARRYANREALDHLTRAFDLVGRLPGAERVDLQMAILGQVGMVRRSMGDMRGAADDFEAMVTIAQEQGRIEIEARGLFYLGSALFWLDRSRFQAAAERALELSGRLREDLLRLHVRSYAAYWNLLLRGWQSDEARAPAAAIEAARQAGDRVLLGQHLARHAYFQCLRTEYRAGCDTAREGMSVALEVGDGFDYLLCQFFLALGLLHAGQWGEMGEVLDRGLRMAGRNGHLLWGTLFRLQKAWLHEQACDFDTALRLCETALQQSRDADHGHGQVISHVLLAAAHAGLGHSERALLYLDEGGGLEQRERELMDWSWQMPLGYCASEIWLACGHRDRARQEAERVRDLAHVPGERTYLALSRRQLARIALAETDLKRAATEISAGRADLEGVDAPTAAWKIEETAAQIALARGRRAEAKRHASRSAAIIDRLAATLARAPALQKSFLRSASVRAIRAAAPAPSARDH